MKNIITQIANKLQSDKVGHFTAGYLVCDVVTHFSFIWLSLITCMFVAIGKELSDKHIRKSAFDWRDVLATCLGGVLNFIIWRVSI